MNPSALPRMKQHASVHSAEYLTKLNKLLSLVKNKTPQINPDPDHNAKKKTQKLRKSLKVWDEKAVNLIYSGSVANTAVNHKKSSAAFVNKKKTKTLTYPMLDTSTVVQQHLFKSIFVFFEQAIIRISSV